MYHTTKSCLLYCSNTVIYRLDLVPRAGFEPATLGLEVLCSIQLSYRGVSVIIPHPV